MIGMEDLLLRVSGLAILAAVVCIILKQLRVEFAPFVRIGATALILLLLLPFMEQVIGEFGDLIGNQAVEPYATVMLRALGISLLCRITSDVCRDAGEAGLASGVEMAGKLLILLLCLPLIRQILSYASEILEGA